MNPVDNTPIILGEIKLLKDELSLMQYRLEYLEGLVNSNSSTLVIPRDIPYNPVVTVYSCPTVDGIYTKFANITSYNGETCNGET